MDLNQLRDDVYAWAQSKGWWETPEDRNVPSKLALIHSEVSEALEEFRTGHMETYSLEYLGKPEGFPSELADVIIRVVDLAGYLGIDLNKEVELKMAYNQTREHRHGGKAV